MNGEQTTIIVLNIFVIWLISLYIRMFDKKLKRYTLSICELLVFWMLVRIIKPMVNKEIESIIWYLYYVAMIFIPTIYYIMSKYIAKKRSKNYIPIITSTMLLIMILTNNIHQFAFTLPDEMGNYSHRIGYFMVCIWIIILFILSTTNLLTAKTNKNKYQTIIIFLPIVLGIIYTVMYVMNIEIIRNTNMSVILGTLICIGIELIIDLNLIPRNIRYKDFFENSKLNMAILSNTGKIEYNSKEKINLLKNIKEDIENNNVKPKYNNIDDPNQIYILEKISQGYVLIKKDFSEIAKLKKQLSKKIDDLEKQEDLLKKDKIIKQKLYDMQIKNEILDELEGHIEEKREKIETNLETLTREDKKKIYMIKLWISYCKTMSSIIISAYNNDIISENKVNIILTELLKDAENLGIKGAYLTNIIDIDSKLLFNIYEIIFCVIENICDSYIYIIINQNKGNIDLKITLLNNSDSIKQKILEKNIVVEENMEEKETEDGKKLLIKICK